MADPIVFPSATTHFSLPLLFSGQTQKEPFINHAFSVIDTLLNGVIVDSLESPPSDPQEGSAYRVLGNASGEWIGRDDNIALWVGGAWEFAPPNNGMTTYDQSAGAQLRYENGWNTAVEPTLPQAGTTIDSEARVAISELIEALRTAGVFGNSAS